MKFVAARAQFFRELLGWAEQHGYERGWAVHAYKAKYNGELPWEREDLTLSEFDAQEPSEKTAACIRRRGREYYRKQRLSGQIRRFASDDRHVRNIARGIA